MFPFANNSSFFCFFVFSYGVHYIKLDAKFWVRTKKWDSPKAVCTVCLLALNSLGWREVSATLFNGSLNNLVDRFSGSTSFPRLTPTRICSEWSCGIGEFFLGGFFFFFGTRVVFKLGLVRYILPTFSRSLLCTMPFYTYVSSFSIL